MACSTANNFLSSVLTSSILLPTPSKRSLHLHPHKPPSITITNCSSDSTPNQKPSSNPDQLSLDAAERRAKSDMLRQARAPSTIDAPKPPNYEIGWKRTKEIKHEKPKGFVIMDFLEKLEGLIGRREYGSAELLAKVGEIVAQGAREEAEVLRGEVDERLITELYRVLKLMQMDLEMVKAAVKEETLNERLQQAEARCRQAILVASSF